MNLPLLLFVFSVIAITFLTTAIKVYKRRPWLINYLKYRINHNPPLIASGSPTHIMFLFVDHFEPKENTKDPDRQKQRMMNWVEKYPKLASKYRDADGFHPQHTWFYQVEDWENSHLDVVYLKQLADLSYDGFGEVELHVHHGPPATHYFPDVDNSDDLTELIEQLKIFYSQTGALITAEEKPCRTYGFIHGMFALGNSHNGKYCGVNNEFQVLSRTGCFADFTMPAGVYVAQSKKINSIYYVQDDPEKPRSFDRGIDVRVGGKPKGDLLLLQGQMWVNFINWPNIFNPTVENSNVDSGALPTDKRIDQWINCNIHVKGQPQWVFVKIHTHGARDESFDVYFGDIADQMYSYLEEKYNDGTRYKLHYVTAREAYNIVKAAEAGEKGDPSQYRDYLIKPYANRKIKSNALYNLQSYSSHLCKLEIVDDQNNIELKFKELMLKELKGAQLRSLDYVFDRSRKEIRISMTGKGEVKCKLIIPQFDPQNVLNVKNAEVISENVCASELECWLSTHLRNQEVMNISIRLCGEKT